MHDERLAIRKWRAGHEAAAQRKLQLLAEEGPKTDQAVAESLAAANALTTMTEWPSARDPVAEREIEQVRRRWARIERRARQARTR